MSTIGQFNKKNPTIKRILKEASELAASTSPDYHAEPLESNLFEWHFTLRGPPAPSPYAGGLYHGRIVLPPAYPLRPPMFRFTTPTGRFEVNREICLSISGHHEETWMPAWGIRTALVALRSFMDTDAKGQVGGIDCEDGVRRRMAEQSGAARCATCGKTNAEIMREKEEAVQALGGGQAGKEGEDEVPEELRLAYRDELGSAAKTQGTATENGQPLSTTQATSTPLEGAQAGTAGSQMTSVSSQQPAAVHSAAPPGQTVQPQRTLQRTRRQDGVPEWVDMAIWGVFMALAFMILRRYVGL